MPVLAGVAEHFADLSTELGYEVSPPEVLINQIGYGRLFSDDYAGAINAFELNVRSYPKSPNVYDSLGEAFEQAGRIEPAEESYREAVRLGEGSGDPNLEIYKQNLGRVVALIAK